jgi:hypothetical protein
MCWAQSQKQTQSHKQNIKTKRVRSAARAGPWVQFLELKKKKKKKKKKNAPATHQI